MKKTIILAAAMMLFAACDKIDPEERLIESGGNDSQWAEGAVAYVEKFTGPLCSNCPMADRTIENLHHTYGDRLVVVSVTSITNSQGNPYGSEPTMQLEATRVWEQRYGALALPVAYINRGDKAYTSSMNDLGGGIEEALMMEPTVKVSVSCDVDGLQLEINTDMELAVDYADVLTLTLMITEDSMQYTQCDGTNVVPDYVHNHMLRAVVTEPWGKSLTMGTTAGSKKHDRTTFNTGGIGCYAPNSHVVALVCDAATHRVLGCAQCNML
jgi:thiol-disulfide isomerase/thioredoxin